MVLSQREKYIAIITGGVLLLFLIYSFVLTPVMDGRSRIRSEKERLETRLEQAQRIFDRRDQLSEEWQRMKAGGLGTDPSVIESRVLNAVEQWSEDCGLPISTIKPDRDRGDGELRKIYFNLALAGDMEAVGRFLWEVENSELPIRIKEFQLGSRGGDGEDLSLQIKLSALYLANDPDAQADMGVN
jgi:Tfp pilus assembly protein PilO